MTWSSYEVIFLWSSLLIRWSFWEVIFSWGYLTRWPFWKVFLWRFEFMKNQIQVPLPPLRHIFDATMFFKRSKNIQEFFEFRVGPTKVVYTIWGHHSCGWSGAWTSNKSMIMMGIRSRPSLFMVQYDHTLSYIRAKSILLYCTPFRYKSPEREWSHEENYRVFGPHARRLNSTVAKCRNPGRSK